MRLRLPGFLWLGCVLLPVATHGQWVEPPGRGWVQLGLYHHDTRTRFDVDGTVRDLFNEGGRSISTSLYATGVLGLWRGLDAWVQVPVHRLAFNDVAAQRERVGFGDPRFYLRLGPRLVGFDGSVPVALRGGLKWPAGTFTRDAEIVPLTEGQRDWELIVEAGHSFWPRPWYLALWAGRRWRMLNEVSARKPGDEWFFYGAAGGAHGRLIFKIALEGLVGGTPHLLGLPVPSARRRLWHLQPSIGWATDAGTWEAAVRLPTRGRNLPAGPAVFAGYFTRFSLPGR